MQATKTMPFLFIVAILLSPALSFAAEVNPQDKSGNYNMTLITLVSLMLILLFVIGMLANTLKQLGLVVRDKVRKERSDAANTLKTILLLLAMTVPVFHSFAGDKVAVVVAPVSQSIQGIP